MQKELLKEIWKQEEQMSFQGWDFSHLNGRWKSEDITWDYKNIVKQYLKPTDMLLDMGTGGGEFLLTLHHPHSLTSVTEAYPPNIELCKQSLSPLGICVKGIQDDSELPFEANQFNCIINRHESFDVNEVNRILKGNGYFITQQVGGENNRALSEYLIENFKPLFPQHNLSHNISLLQQAGFEILVAKEEKVPIKFYDVGAIVYYCKIIEWEFPGFSVEACFDKLLELQKQVEQTGYYVSYEHRFIIVSKKI